jgi:hypothetical protein
MTFGRIVDIEPPSGEIPMHEAPIVVNLHQVCEKFCPKILVRKHSLRALLGKYLNCAKVLRSGWQQGFLLPVFWLSLCWAGI